MNPLVDALRLIAEGGCTNYKGGGDCPASGRTPIARYSADRWCNACIARAGLDASARTARRPMFNDRYQRAMEANFANQREAFALLDLVDSEFRSDPMSTQCFDARIVDRIRECVAARGRFEKEYPHA